LIACSTQAPAERHAHPPGTRSGQSWPVS